MLTRHKIGLSVGLVGLLLVSLLWREVEKEETSNAGGSAPWLAVDDGRPIARRLPKERAPDAPATSAHTGPQSQSSSQAITDPVIREFRLWAGRYMDESDRAVRLKLIEAGRRLASAHRQAIKQLISQDPRSALRQAVPVALRRGLPSEILAELEERINARAYYGVYADGPEPIRRIVEIAGSRYTAYVYGRRLAQLTTEEDSVVGIAVDRVMAVDEWPVRRLEPGEFPDPGKPLLKTSPESSTRGPIHEHTDPPFGETAPIVEAGGKLRQLCCRGYLARFEGEIFGFEGGTGGPVKPFGPMPLTPSTGVHSVLYLRVAFPDAGLDPQSEAAAYDMMRQVNDWFVPSSYGNLYLVTTVAPLVTLPRSEVWYKNVGNELDLRDDALAAARAMGYDGEVHDHVLFVYLGGPGSFQGLATIGGRFVWLKAINVGTAAHELGHNFGLQHANSWETAGQSIIGPGTNLEYGNSYDWMGSSRAGNGDFNACWKNQIGWLGGEFVHQIRESGTYRVYACDQPALEPARRYAFKVRRGGQGFYWGEYRQRFDPSNPSLVNGILLNWSPWSQSAAGTDLLDATPGTPGGKNDAALTIGRTLSDPDSGMHITPVGKGSTAPQWIEVVVKIGPFPENRPPGIAVIALQTNIAPGETARFTATAIDPDGDTLAYSWDFGDGGFSTDNVPEASRAWNMAGRYVVRCLVSDMKGGTASDSVMVTVGSPTNFFISGQITLAGQPLANVRVHNGLSGAQYRGTFTHSDGTYTLTGLASGSTTVSALLFGYSFTAGFVNPVSVGPDFTGANLTAQEAVVVSLLVLDPTTTEGVDTATIRLVRSGPVGSSLGVALAQIEGPIRVEYNVTPRPDFIPSISDYGWVIPAGKSSIDIVFEALEDDEIEGPEALTIEIRSTASYVAAGGNPAMITFLDLGPPLPVVSVEVIDGDANETGDGAVFGVSRRGSTANALNVQYDLSGSALNGIDYAAIDSSVVIPAGQSSVTILIAPINDTEIEGGEDVILSLSPNASYLVSQTAKQASAVLLDDDVPTVSIVATDATASEAGQDPATFVITRRGDNRAPLTVGYAIGGSAHHGVDYAPLPGELTIPAGASAASITVVPVDDDIGEPAQTVLLQIRSGTGYVVGNPGNATATLVDNDMPVVTLGVSDGSFAEPADTGQFRFTTAGSGGGNITIHYTVTGTAIPGVDYVTLPGTLSMGRNTTATVTVTPLDDGVPEDLETVTVTIDPDAAYTTFLDKTATLNLLDNEQNIVNVTPAAGSLLEGSGGTLGFYISRQGSTASSLTVNYVMSGTALNSVDYQQLSGTTTIAAGKSGVSFGAAILDDAVMEGNERVTLTLTPSAVYGLGIASATRYIADDEAPAIKVGFGSPGGGGNENAGTVNIPVTFTAAPASPVTVEYAIAGGSATGGIDYNLAAGVLTFAPGVTATNILLTIIDDLFDEPTETVIIELKNAWGAALGTSTYTYTINDNDNPPPATVGFAATASAAGENVSPAVLLVSLSAALPAPVTVHYAPTGGAATGGGVDYTLVPGTLTFAPGETVKSISIPIIDDTVNEPNETIIVTLDSPTGATLNANTTHTYTISNIAGTLDVTPVAGLDSSGFGGGPFSPASATYTLRNIGDTVLNWTASPNATWVGLSVASGTLNPGASTDVVISLNAEADSLLPQTGTATVTFTNTSNNNGNTSRTVSLNVLLAAPVLAAEPAFTSGSANTISWSTVAGAEVYEVQQAASAGFANPTSSGWISAATHNFIGLTDCTRYYYRVRGWRTAANPPAGPWSATLSSAQDVASPVVSCSTNRVVQSTNPSGVVVAFTTTASDLCDLSPTVTCAPASGSIFPLGTSTVTCTALDAANNAATCSFSVTVNLNRLPIVVNDDLGVVENHARSVALDKLLLNDTDEDGDPLTLLTVSAVSTNGGVVVLSGANVIYNPVSNYVGSDSFTYTVSDGRGGTATATVFVTVLDENDTSANRISLTTVTGQGVVLRFAGIPGFIYNIERSTDLQTWSVISNGLTVPANGVLEFTDTMPPGGTAFYRTISP